MLTASRRSFAISFSSALALAVTSTSSPRAAPLPREESRAFDVDANVGLAAFIQIADGHLQKLADALQVLALSGQAQSAKWADLVRPLGEVGKLNADALNWFALPDGSYWSVQNGREKGNLSTRAYFPKVLAGKMVLGDLVVSKATGKSVAVIAVPVKGPEGKIVGVLGASVYLDKLSARIREEMKLGDELIFYTFDATPLLALVWDEGLIFKNPKELGPEVDRAFTEMLSKDHGMVRYPFRGKQRTVVFRKSAVTGWWYALGFVGVPNAAQGAR